MQERSADSYRMRILFISEILPAFLMEVSRRIRSSFFGTDHSFFEDQRGEGDRDRLQYCKCIGTGCGER